MFSKILIALAIASTVVNAEPIQRRAATNVWPSPPTTSQISAPIRVKAGQTFTPPQPYTRYHRGAGACGNGEGGEADAVFILEEGATLSRVVIGKDQMEGVHCLGQCTVEYVYFEDVCEDAITIKQKSGVSRINYGGAKGASDKIVQHNGGGKVIINSFYSENFGKLYRSCGNCKTQYQRSVEINDSWAVKGSTLVGINTNYGDTAKIRRTRASNVKTICDRFTGNNSGKEPTKTGSGPDGAEVAPGTDSIDARDYDDVFDARSLGFLDDALENREFDEVDGLTARDVQDLELEARTFRARLRRKARRIARLRRLRRKRLGFPVV